MTPLRVVVYLAVGGRYQWRLENAYGNHAVVVSSGAAYMTELSAVAGAKRFLTYLREEAPIMWAERAR